MNRLTENKIISLITEELKKIDVMDIIKNDNEF